MKKIFIYYSLTGNGDIVADYLFDKGYDIRKVEPKVDLPKRKFLSILKGGFLAGLDHKSKLKDFDNNIESYAEVIIGSPVWNDKLSCPINAVLDKIDLTNKKTTFILYSGSGRGKKATEKINKLYNARVIKLKEAKGNEKELDRIK